MRKGASNKISPTRLVTTTLSFILLIVLACQEASAQDMESLFNQKCAGCHTIGGGNSVGPDLAPSTKWNASALSKSIKDMEKNVGPLSTAEIVGLVEFLKGKGSPAKSTGTSASGPPATASSGPGTSPSTAEVSPSQNQAGTTGGANGHAPEAIPGQPTSAPTGSAPDTVTAKSLTEPASAERGARLFTGSEALKNGGLSCIACHSIDGAGGTMAVELNEIYKKMAPQALVTACEKTPFKVMKTAYKDHPLEHQEALDLAAYLTSLKEPHEKLTEIPVTPIALVFAGAVFAIIALGYRGAKGSAREKLQRRK